MRPNAPRLEPRYLLFWMSPERVPSVVEAIGETGDGTSRILGFGVPCSALDEEGTVPSRVHAAFAAARAHRVAVMLHFDFHVAWRNRPDLWNWFGPDQPGYDPANVRNVEWFGWDGPVAKARYLNWGAPERMPPPVCYTSDAVRAEWVRLIREVVGPPLVEEVAALDADGLGNLFAGVLVGSEPTFDNYSATDPETARLVAEDDAPQGQLGYRALLDRGYSKGSPPADIHDALGAVIQETVAFWSRQFVEAGLPVAKLYTHIPAGAPQDWTSSPVSAAFSEWSRPGWSTYAVGPLEQGFDSLYAELARHGDPPWGGVEANAGAPGSLVDWETYLAWHYNHGAQLVGVNTGATGKDLPDRLERSAFGEEALAAYRRFLRGEPLEERPLRESPQTVLRRRIDAVQAAARAWQAAGRDPSPVVRPLEERLPGLVQAGDIEGAKSLLDDVLRQLDAHDGRAGAP